MGTGYHFSAMLEMVLLGSPAHRLILFIGNAAVVGILFLGSLYGELQPSDTSAEVCCDVIKWH